MENQPTYNSQLEKLKMPEYGRNIQQMVDHCLQIEDREERTRCAYTIIQVMGNLLPHLRDEADSKHKLWDHLAIMSNFELDIDYPYDILKAENLHSRPEPLDYNLQPIRMRHYGKIIERMINRACEYPEGEERDALVLLLANHMKKLMFAQDKDGVDDARVLKDLYELSHCRINLDPATTRLHVFQEAPAATTGKKNKTK